MPMPPDRSVDEILDDFRRIQGWDDAALLSLLGEYIERQQDNGALANFLARAMADEDLEEQGHAKQ